MALDSGLLLGNDENVKKCNGIKDCASLFPSDELIHKIKRKWMKLRLQPIRVYCLHHVCAEFDAESMNECDWMQIDEFKQMIETVRKGGVEFISLTDAYHHVSKDWFRCKKYAVLTFDDGYTTLREILPWLEEQVIPATLFINGKYLDGKSYRKNPNERYLTRDELFAMTSPLLEIGSHGWEHVLATEQTELEFEQSVEANSSALSQHPRYVPFYAYTYGAFTSKTNEVLHQHSMIPIYIDGVKNYSDNLYIHRELLKS